MPTASSAAEILFIGNSYTSRNDLPRLIAAMVEASTGRAVRTKMIVAGGASLRRHWNAGSAASAIQGGCWNYVVLQEQSTLPLKNRARYHDNVRLFDGVVRAAGARTVLYLTWTRRDASAMQAAITDAVMQIGGEIGALVAPVGLAWQAAMQRHPDIALYLPDGSHPTAAASYLAACVFAGALFGVDACTLTMPHTATLSDADARRLAVVASEVVSTAPAVPVRSN